MDQLISYRLSNHLKDTNNLRTSVVNDINLNQLTISQKMVSKINIICILKI